MILLALIMFQQHSGKNKQESHPLSPSLWLSSPEVSPVGSAPAPSRSCYAPCAPASGTTHPHLDAWVALSSTNGILQSTLSFVLPFFFI